MFRLIVVSVLLLSFLTGCGTMYGLGQDISAASRGYIEQTNEQFDK